MQLSIVATLYRSAPYLEEFYRRCVAAAEGRWTDFEIVLVNDGSPDESLLLAQDLHAEDSRVVVVDLSRNFGHHKAMMAGLAHARGDLVFLIDSDLEEPPEILSVFHERMLLDKCDVVYGVQEIRRGSLLERVSGEIFYALINHLTDVTLPRNLMTVRLMSRRYVRSLLRHRERELVISGLWVVTGYDQVAVTVKKSRVRPTSYGLVRKVKLAIDYATSFSSRVLYWVFNLGLVISMLAGVSLLFLVVRYIFFGGALQGWTSVMASIWLFGGLTILFVGLVGIYVARVFNETKRRPYVIVRSVLRNEMPRAEQKKRLDAPQP